ncbi:hypothetical protein OSB04_000017 [Centaurea solstitialis]|uniref:Scarecrow-like protein 32 n=1 Tax=Centaurea solstitialis TaxID=347529 RepID=A0AA38WUA9_9ASTR|nr:hypothetical protein OSB04_000017 [Centaurea solstitialis]
MMQFTETLPPPLHHQTTNKPCQTTYPTTTNSLINNPNQLNRTRPWPGFPANPTKPIGTFGDANCMEQLLVRCATAIETNDATLSQQILWVLNNIAPSDGDSNQRLTCGFLRALIARAAKTGTCKMLTAALSSSAASITIQTHKFSIIELASFVDLTPWHRFGFTAANAAILEAVEGYAAVHIIDLSLTHCMQIPTLIDAMAGRLLEGGPPPPVVKLTIAGATEDVPPMLDLSYEELGVKLVNFARSRNIILEFTVIPSSSLDGFSSLIEHLKLQTLVHGTETGEALIDSTPRALFLKQIRTLNPTLVVLADEDADFTSTNLVARLRSAFNYLWIPYDIVDTFLPRGSKQRQWYEADICWKIENVIAQEGSHRVERLEPRSRWVHRMRNTGFRGVGFGEDMVAEVKGMLDEHAAGWGLKKEEDDLVLTWKGHNVVFATAWVPT